MLVEDIQDIIEEKLMNFKKYELAKVYIIYRYNRALIRKSNGTDETILEIIKNTGRNYWDKKNNLVMTKRNLISNLVSKDLTMRILLPEKIARSHEEGLIYFNDLETFIQPSINSSHINLDDMLENGTIIGGNEMPHINSFTDACLFATQIAFEIANGQHGEAYLELKHLLKYLKPGDDINDGVNILQNQFNNMVTIYGTPIQINLMIEIDEAKETYLRFYEKILQVSWNSNIKLMYMHNSNILDDTVTKNIEKGLNIIVINDINMLNCYRFDQGIVTINLADANDLNMRLELCHEALMFKHHSLMGTLSMTSPIHYLYGGIARIEDDKIDKLLKSKYSTITLGYSGLREMITSTGVEDALKVISQIKKTIKKWSEEDNLDFRLQPIFTDDVCCYLSLSDSDKDMPQCYSNCIDADDIYEKIRLENKVGIISRIKCQESEINEIFKYIEDNKFNVEFII